MAIRKMQSKIAVALIVALASAQAAPAQVRKLQAPPPAQPPSLQAPNISPTSQAMANFKLQIEALRQSVGRQVVVLHFSPAPETSWPDSDNSFPKNNTRAEAMCKEALGERYGRVLSRKAEPDLANDRWYFPNLVCETAP